VSVGKFIGGMLLAVVVILGLMWVLTGNEFFLYKVFAPKVAVVQRQVWEESPSYIQGMVNNVSDLMGEWGKAKAKKDTIAMRAIEQSVLSRTSSFPLSKLPIELHQWVESIKSSVR
jgi:hypothetical protein